MFEMRKKYPKTNPNNSIYRPEYAHIVYICIIKEESQLKCPFNQMRPILSKCQMNIYVSSVVYAMTKLLTETNGKIHKCN